MSTRNEKLAHVLESAADYIDALEAENQRMKAAESATETQRIEVEAQKLAQQFHLATGEELDPTLAQKIAGHSDEEIRTVLQKLAGPENAVSLGSSQRVRGKEASSGDEAWDRFGDYLLSS